MLAEELQERYPELLHVTFATSWQKILETGLWSAERLTELLQLLPHDRHRLIAKRRHTLSAYEHETLGRVTFRDHKGIPQAGLGSSLIDMTAHEWYRELNRRVFFYVQSEPAARMIAAYPDEPHVTIAVDTERLLTSCADRVALSTINTGYGFRRPARRGRDTFIPLNEFGGRLSEVIEVTVEDGIENIADIAVAVDSHDGETSTRIWPNEG